MQAKEGGEELLHVQGQEGRLEEILLSEVRSSGCALLEQLLRDTHVQVKKNPNKMVSVVRGHQRADRLKS